jgi:hypothetical protein
MPANQVSASILHVPYRYFPDPCGGTEGVCEGSGGGTEVYVRGLAQRLSAIGYVNTIAAALRPARPMRMLVCRSNDSQQICVRGSIWLTGSPTRSPPRASRQSLHGRGRTLCTCMRVRQCFGEFRRSRTCCGRARGLYLSYADGELRPVPASPHRLSRPARLCAKAFDCKPWRSGGRLSSLDAASNT